MKQNQNHSVLKAARRIALSVLLSWSVAIAVCMIGAAMISAGTLKEKAGGYCNLLAILAGALLGCLLAVKRGDGNKLLQSLLHGTVFFVSLLCAGILLFEGTFHGIGVTAVLVFGGSLAALLVRGKGKERTYHRKMKYKTRAFVQNIQTGK